MKIQNLLLPKVGICTVEPMYFRREEGYNRELQYDFENHEIHFLESGLCSFDTYFNGLSVEKWKKYTNIEEFSLVLELKGHFEVKLINLELTDKFVNIDSNQSYNVRNGDCVSGVSYKIISDNIIDTDEIQRFEFPYKLYEYRGILSFQLKSLKDGSVFYGGYYDGKIDSEKIKETNIAINICTFKRDAFVLRNINILKENIIDNPNNCLSQHLQVYISDNGHTLPIKI